MHNTHMGSHAPPHVNQLPMAAEPKDFVHFKEVEGGKMLAVSEEGANNFRLNTTTDFQKYSAKKQPRMHIGYDHKVDMKNDNFLNNLSKEEKMKFDDEIKKIWWKKGSVEHKEDIWYMILEGGGAKKKYCGLYQDKDVFEQVRDKDYDAVKNLWSLKGCWFEDLETAKNYIQMSRDEEGVHWEWPQKITVFWKKGPLTNIDIENCPAFQSCEEDYG